MKTNNKPHIRFNRFNKCFECAVWADTPGEKCHISGEGPTPKDAYAEFLTCLGWYRRDHHGETPDFRTTRAYT